MNRAALIVKRGDQICDPARPYLGKRNGQPVDVIVESEWKGQSLDKIISKNMREVYAVCEIDPAKASLYKSWLNPINEIDPINYRAAAKYIDFKDIADTVGSSDLESKLLGGVDVPTIDLRSIETSLFKDALEVVPIPKVIDLKAINSGSYTIGSGGDYATVVAFEADIAAITGDLTGSLISDTTESGVVLLNLDTSGNTLRITSNVYHGGKYNSGYKIQINHTNYGIASFFSAGSVFQIDSVIIERLVSASAERGNIQANSQGGASNVLIKNCLIKGNGGANDIGIRGVSTNDVISMFNCLFWNLERATTNTIGSGSVYENNVCIGAGSYGFQLGNTTMTARNNVAMGSGTGDYFGLTNVTLANNASSDATGSAGLQSRTTADFLSVTESSDDFCNIDSDSFLFEAGTTSILAANTTGIRGNPRPNGNGAVSIGANEPVASSAGFGSLLSDQRNKLVF